MKESEAQASADYARNAARTLVGGSVVFAMLAVFLVAVAVEDDEPTRALAALAGLGFGVLAVMLAVMSMRARRAFQQPDSDT